MLILCNLSIFIIISFISIGHMCTHLSIVLNNRSSTSIFQHQKFVSSQMSRYCFNFHNIIFIFIASTHQLVSCQLAENMMHCFIVRCILLFFFFPHPRLLKVSDPQDFFLSRIPPDKISLQMNR